MSHSRLTDETLSREEERRLLRAGERLFRSHFPNPDRTGCPGPEVLRTMASRKPSSIPDDFLDHLMHCSPCFVEYDRQLARARRMRRLRTIAACGGLVALIGIAFWFAPGALHSVEQPQVAVEGPSHRTEVVAVLDLRNASQARGGEQATPAEPPLSIPRTATTLQIYLPIGSEEGLYEVGLFRSQDESVIQAQGTAESSNQKMILQINVDLSNVAPGEYALGFRRPEFLWRYQVIEVQ
ncbi:MAG: hypothetical protein P8020_21610 [Acidobacteriota bacterium]